MKYYLTCVHCQDKRQASPVRYQKWQIRLAQTSKGYICKDCRKKLPKEIRVTIPDETLPLASNPGMTDIIRSVRGYQTLKIKKR